MGKRDYECTPWGMPDLQHLRLAEAVLSAAGRLRRHLQGADARPPSGRTTARRAATASAPIAWCTAATKPAVNDTFGSLARFLGPRRGDPVRASHRSTSGHSGHRATGRHSSRVGHPSIDPSDVAAANRRPTKARAEPLFRLCAAVCVCCRTDARPAITQ